MNTNKENNNYTNRDMNNYTSKDTNKYTNNYINTNIIMNLIDYQCYEYY